MGEAGARLLRIAAYGAPISFVVIALVVVVIQQALPATLPGEAPRSTPVATFDPQLVGPGMLGTAPELLPFVPWLVAVGVAAAVIAAAYNRGRAARITALGLATAAFIASYGIAAHPGPRFGHAWGAPLAIDVVRTSNPFEGRDVGYITADPGEPFVIAFNVSNPGVLPIRLLGIVHEPFEGEAVGWRAVWSNEGSPDAVLPLERAEPFQPIEIAPGEYVDLYLVGHAGACASAIDTGTGSARGSVRVAFAVLGITGVESMELPVIVAEHHAENCLP